ncbi:hypothetical protein ATCC90586_007230 [Pythium insidiosum]|nr:hypothetical protein ATCC90586_007230 [Pythium insidiosum]
MRLFWPLRDRSWSTDSERSTVSQSSVASDQSFWDEPAPPRDQPFRQRLTALRSELDIKTIRVLNQQDLHKDAVLVRCHAPGIVLPMMLPAVRLALQEPTDAVVQVAKQHQLDGACRRNPSAAGAGAVLFAPTGEVVWTCSHYLPGNETNNTGEYHAMLAGVESAVQHGEQRLCVEGDSHLVLAQVRGTFACANRRLRRLRARARARAALRRIAAPGHDGVGYDVYKRFAAQLTPLLHAAFVACWRHARVPAVWKVGIVRLIHKKGDASVPTNWRPICLQPAIYKLYTGVLTRRLSSWLEANERLPPSQKGFRACSGCAEHQFLATSLVDQERRLHRPLYESYSYLGVGDDFDHVRYRLQFDDKLSALKREAVTLLRSELAPHQILKTLKVYVYPKVDSRRFVDRVRTLDDDGFFVVANAADGATAPVRREQGVFQGCPLSPLLFIVVLAPLLRVLEQDTDAGLSLGYGLRVCAAPYADGIKVFSGGADGIRQLHGVHLGMHESYSYRGLGDGFDHLRHLLQSDDKLRALKRWAVTLLRLELAAHQIVKALKVYVYPKVESQGCAARLEFLAATMDYDVANMVPHTCVPPSQVEPELNEDSRLLVVRNAMKRDVDTLAIQDSSSPQQIWERVRDKYYNRADNVVARGMSKSQVIKRINHVRAQYFGADIHGRVEVAPLSRVKQTTLNFFQFHHVWTSAAVKTETQIDRVIGWANPSLLALLRYGDLTLFVDATFRCVPRMFRQCVVIMVYDKASKLFVPVFYVLMASKTYDAYWNLLQYISDAEGDRVAPTEVRKCLETQVSYSTKKWGLFCAYFRHTWLKLLPPSLWNISGIRRDIVARTNNPLERFNRQLNAGFSSPHPSIAQFVYAIDDISRRYVKLRDDIIRGLAKPPMRETRPSLPSATSLPRNHQDEAVYIKNRVYCKATNTTPYEKMFGVRPDIHHIRTFGSLAYVHVAKTPNRPREVDNAKIGFVLGLREDIVGMLVYFPDENTKKWDLTRLTPPYARPRVTRTVLRHIKLHLKLRHLDRWRSSSAQGRTVRSHGGAGAKFISTGGGLTDARVIQLDTHATLKRWRLRANATCRHNMDVIRERHDQALEEIGAAIKRPVQTRVAAAKLGLVCANDDGVGRPHWPLYAVWCDLRNAFVSLPQKLMWRPYSATQQEAVGYALQD